MSFTIIKENNICKISWYILVGDTHILFEDDNVTDFMPWKNLYESVLTGTPFELKSPKYSIRSGGSVSTGTLYFGFDSNTHISVSTPITQKILDDLKIISCMQEI